MSDTSTEEAAGTQIGRYRLLEQTGEGGMGTIWLADATRGRDPAC